MSTDSTEDIIDDLEDIDYGDMKIRHLYTALRKEHEEKGLTYQTLGRSRFYKRLKYLITFHNTSKISVTDLDSNEEIYLP